MWIERCVCTQQPFGDLLAQAQTHGWDLVDVIGCTDAGGGCGRCLPYLEAALATGQSGFDTLLPMMPEAAIRALQQQANARHPEPPEAPAPPEPPETPEQPKSTGASKHPQTSVPTQSDQRKPAKQAADACQG